jgi:hypothetical protein
LTSTPDTTTLQKREKRERSRRLLVVQIVFYCGVVLFGIWLLSSVALHLMWDRGPLLGHGRISKKPSQVEIFHCYLDTLTLFNVIMEDYGSVTARTRCKRVSVKKVWSSIYAWDTYPFSEVRKGVRVRPKDVGIWRYRKYQVWTRCRLDEKELLSRNRALRELSNAHIELDALRQVLTRQLHAHVSSSASLVEKIRRRLNTTYGTLKNKHRLMKKWKHVIPARLRKWGIRRQPKPICPI